MLRDLLKNPRNSVDGNTLDEKAKAAFSRLAVRFRELPFWKGDDGTPRLWNHQREALLLAAAYLAAEPRVEHPARWREAGLVKMPTGTGKTGVIAVLARCLPQVRRVLVLTPRADLVQQMRRDLRWRFWRRFGYEYVNDVLPLYRPNGGPDVEAADVLILLPSLADGLCDRLRAGSRVVAVGTFAALEQIESAAARTERPTATDATGEPSADAGDFARHCASLVAVLRELVDLVIVDEGHYEPAPEWGRAVRSLDRPLLLFSATPVPQRLQVLHRPRPLRLQLSPGCRRVGPHHPAGGARRPGGPACGDGRAGRSRT